MVAQMAHVLPLLVAAQFVILVIRLIAGGTFPGWSYFAASVVSVALWPMVTFVLQAPQRRATDTDENRPI